ncbi:MAG: 23S rRNA (adenine(2503)-C(2))-methyltransferase RlmN, partial [Clostridia bacterium]
VLMSYHHGYSIYIITIGCKMGCNFGHQQDLFYNKFKIRRNCYKLAVERDNGIKISVSIYGQG